MLPNNTEITYDKLFEFLKDNHLYPTNITLDFEQAALKSFEKYFPDTEQHGCFFHFSQAIWRKIQNVGLQNPYNTDAIVASHLRFLTALAFVPPKDVHTIFELFNQYEIFKLTNDNRCKKEIK